MNKKSNALQTALMLIEILRCIPRGYKISARDIQEHLRGQGIERDIRTIQRQLELLTEYFDIERDDRSRPFGYRWKELSAGLSLPYLSKQESLLLQLAQQQLTPLLPASMTRSLKGFFAQAGHNLMFSKDATLEKQWLSKIRVISTSQQLLPPKIKPQIFDEVSDALYGNHWLKIDYHNAKGNNTQSEVMPLGLAQQGSVLYLVCRFKDFENERTLALHRFNKAEKLDKTFSYPKDFDLLQYDAQGRFGFGNGQKIQLTFKIKKSTGLHIVESPLSVDQTIIEDDYYYTITATLVNTLLLDQWLRGFGDDVIEISKVKI